MSHLLFLLSLLGCPSADAAPGAWITSVTRLPQGDVVDLVLEEGRIAAVHPAGQERASDHAIDGSGRFVTAAAIDSHVHVAYLPVGAELTAAGVVAVVDHAAPESAITQDHGVEVVHAGPMLAAPGGYPTQSWGRSGYGAEVADADAARAQVERMHAAGARVLKLSFGAGPDLDDAVARAAVDRAHALGMVVAAHALNGAAADRAAALGVDVLSHTPVGALSKSQARAWAGRAVVSTLGAFGGSDVTVANLQALREAGATVLYGTDLGNTRRARIDEVELALLAQAGLDGAAILESLTSAPAAFWGLEGLGRVAEGARASLLLLSDDPRTNPGILSAPDAVFVDGRRP